jgi:hypothetical protein
MIARASAALALAVAALAQGYPEPPAARGAHFVIRTVARSGGAREVLSSATVAGPPSCAIQITAEEGIFRLSARVVARAEADAVRLLARVETRRLAGHSDRGLPLYEEDVQSQTARLAGDGSQVLAVFPFGRDAPADELSIEIVPSLAGAAPPSPEIRIERPGPAGWIRLEAEVVPRAVEIEAEIVAGGQVIARGSGTAFPDEMLRLPLAPVREGGPAAELAITVDRYSAVCAAGPVGFTFDLDRFEPGIPPQADARAWSGVTRPGAPADYQLDQWPGGAVLRLACTPVLEGR